MKHLSTVSVLVVAAALALGCSKKSDKKQSTDTSAGKTAKAPAKATPPAPAPKPVAQTEKKAPPAPPMPADWKVLEDVAISGQDTAPIAKALGANIAALRNTTYLVNGKQIKLNAIVGRDKAAADKLEKKLNTMKPAEFSFRKGDVIWEFVGTDAALPEIRAARAHLLADK